MLLKVSLDKAEENVQSGTQVTNPPVPSGPSARSSIDIAKSVGPLWRVGSTIWLIVVIIIVIYMVYNLRIGTAISFCFVFAGTVYFEFTVQFKRPGMHIMYWVIKVTIICLITGFISGHTLVTQEEIQEQIMMDITKFAPFIAKNLPLSQQNEN